MTRRFALAFVLLLGAGAPALQAGASGAADDAAILHALNRLTYGPRQGDVERTRAMGLQKWIDLQLTPARIDDSALEARLRRLETLTLDPETIQREYTGPAMMERRQRKLAQEMPADSRLPDPGSRQASEVIKRD